MSADVIAALVALQKAEPDVAAIAGAHVYGVELPAKITKDMPLSALVIVPSGGSSMTGGSFVEHDRQRIDLFAYGATPFEADLLRRKASLAFRRVRRSVHAGVLIHAIEPAGGFFSARDPDAAWPRAFQSFQIFHALEEITP